MKHTRLLEIIREEIAGALNEIEKGDIELPSGTSTSTAQQYINKGFNVRFVDKTTGKITQKEAQLEEDALNEEPFIDSALDITGTTPENFNQDALQNAIDDAVKVLQQENPDADVKALAGKLQKANNPVNLGPKSKLSSELKNALQKVNDVIVKQGQIFGSIDNINDLIKLAKEPSQIDRLEKLKLKGYTFILGNPQAITAIEKSLGLKPKNNDFLGAVKDKAEKSFKVKTSTPKNPKEKSEPKAKESKTDAGVDDEGNEIEIDTKIQTPTGDTDIESRLNSVISAKKTKLKAAKKGSLEFKKELAALTSFLQGSEISKYIKKKIVGGKETNNQNPYSISNILKDIE
jgi:hypothetical protein